MSETMPKSTQQMQVWTSRFGKDYTDRTHQSVEEVDALYIKNFGVARTDLNSEFLADLDRSIKILEVGCNMGAQLQCLQSMGFENLYGIELQQYAVRVAKQQTRDAKVIQGSIFNIPFKDNYFDLVFTSGVLIHIHPDDIQGALREVGRCTRNYIWGYEYYSPEHIMIPYRGKENLLWKGDFAQPYLSQFSKFKILKEKMLQYLNNENVDSMFLLGC